MSRSYKKRYYDIDATDDNYMFPYNRVRDTRFSQLRRPTTEPTDVSEYIQDNVYIDKYGDQYIRSENDYELLNTVIDPETLIRNSNYLDNMTREDYPYGYQRSPCDSTLESRNSNIDLQNIRYTITPRRLAADPSGVIGNYLWCFNNLSDTGVIHNNIRALTKNAIKHSY